MRKEAMLKEARRKEARRLRKKVRMDRFSSWRLMMPFSMLAMPATWAERFMFRLG